MIIMLMIIARRGLFEDHKLLFSFLVTVQILRNKERLPGRAGLTGMEMEAGPESRAGFRALTWHARDGRMSQPSPGAYDVLTRACARQKRRVWTKQKLRDQEHCDFLGKPLITPTEWLFFLRGIEASTGGSSAGGGRGRSLGPKNPPSSYPLPTPALQLAIASEVCRREHLHRPRPQIRLEGLAAARTSATGTRSQQWRGRASQKKEVRISPALLHPIPDHKICSGARSLDFIGGTDLHKTSRLTGVDELPPRECTARQAATGILDEGADVPACPEWVRGPTCGRARRVLSSRALRCAAPRRVVHVAFHAKCLT